MRRLDPLTPDEARELAAIDRALCGAPLDPDLREFEELVADMRATAPEMTPAFAARLERDVADGFPEPVERPLLRRPRRWVMLPAVGVLAAALVALVVVLGHNGETTSLSSSDPGAGVVEAPRESVTPTVTDNAAGDSAGNSAGGATAESKAAPADLDRRAAAPAPALAAPAPSAQALSTPPPVAKSSAPRKVERTADLVLETPTSKFDRTSDDVIRKVDEFGGIVASSAIGSDDEAGGEAVFDLRIPTARLDDAIAALSKLGHVAERRQNLQDITGSFTSAQDRLADARAERRGLLRALARATTQAQIESLRARLRATGSTISRLKGDLASLRRRADLSRVSLTVRGVDDGSGATTGGNWSPVDAAGDALRVLEVMAGVALVTLAIAVPLGLLGIAIALAARSARRRGRERALDPA
jgi:hypothetical protein